jgi:hypothetical protein
MLSFLLFTIEQYIYTIKRANSDSTTLKAVTTTATILKILDINSYLRYLAFYLAALYNIISLRN